MWQAHANALVFLPGDGVSSSEEGLLHQNSTQDRIMGKMQKGLSVSALYKSPWKAILCFASGHLYPLDHDWAFESLSYVAITLVLTHGIAV